MKRRVTRRSAVLIVLAMLGGVLAASVGTASAAPTVLVSPNSGLVSGQVVSVTITADVTAAHFYAVTQCGNADAAGNSIAPGNQADCAGQATLGTNLRLVSSTGLDLSALAGGIVAGNQYTAPLTMQRTGIGANGAQCLPVGGAIVNPCTVAVAESDAAQNVYSQVTVPITYRPPATVTISSVSGQNGTAAARAGNAISIGGGNWDANGTLTAQLCSTGATPTCDAAGVTGSGSTSAGGAASGTFTVQAAATTGSRSLRVTDGVQTASVAVEILGARSISLSSTAGGAGTVITVNGAGFDAGVTVAVSATNGTGGVGAPDVVTSGATGAILAHVTISDPATVGISAVQLDALGNPDLPPAGGPPGDDSADACTVAGAAGCQVLQTVNLTVTGSTLSIAQAGNQIAMSGVTLNGQQQTSTGQLNNVTITDARGSLVGWTVTATMSNLVRPGGASNSTIAAANMSVTPGCAPQSATSGSTTGITVGGPNQAFGGASPVGLCLAAAGEGGGTYTVTGGLTLTVPATIRSGGYSSTLTILLV